MPHDFSPLPSSLSLSAVDAPTITGQPTSLSMVEPGESASFTVTATSEDGNLSYQWQKGTDSISGATSATYTINEVMESDEGEYRCVVSNAAGSVTSAAASLTVCKCVCSVQL